MRRLLWPATAALIALGILLSLGTWQLMRRAEKAEILSSLERSATATPVRVESGDALRLRIVSSGSSAGPDTMPELTRVVVIGRYANANSIPVRATLPATKGSPVSGIGFFWMTPLELDGGAVVFVNRGFVPSGGDWRAPAIPTPEGPQTVTGLIRLPEKPRMFLPPDDPAKGEYFNRDPSMMARAVGLPNAQVAPFFIDAERAAGSATPPVGVDPREMIARIPNNHLQYAVTWFGLAGTLIGVFAFFARSRLKDTSA